jgi:hypothetical protein
MVAAAASVSGVLTIRRSRLFGRRMIARLWIGVEC